MAIDIEKLKATETPADLPFRITKLGHVVLMVTDLQRSVDFYCRVLGFRVSDVYPEDMMPGGMVFLRCNTDHHGIALVGAAPGRSENIEMHHLAFEVGSLDEVLRVRRHLRAHQAQIDFDGRRRAGRQMAVEFRDPDGHRLEIYWGLDQIGSDGYVCPSSDWRRAFSLEEAIDNPPPGQDTTVHDPSLRED